MGEFKKKRFEPAQPFALVLSENTYMRTVSLPSSDERLAKYFCGETVQLSEEELSTPQPKKGGNSWYLLLADGYPVGFGKLAQNKLKNKYPAGWRQRG